MEVSRSDGRAPGRGAAVRDLAAGLPGVVVVAAAVAALQGLGLGYLGLALALYAVQAGLILRASGRDLLGAGIGPANRVTLLRSVLVIPVAALAVPPGSSGARGDGEAWLVIGLSTVALILDGVDGWVARRTRTESRVGARWDMELDAFLMLVLSLLVWEHGRAGAWVVLIGALRYLFVAAGVVRPELRAPLPPSLRRKTVCVVQGVALLVALGPVVPGGLAVASVAVALALLVYSFAVDVLWLVRAGREPGGRPGRG